MKFALKVLQQLNFFEVLLIIGTPIWLILYIKGMYQRNQRRKNYKKRMQQLEEENCGQGNHKWVYMWVDNTEAHVCKKCCWCPDLESYIKRFFVDAHIERLNFLEELDKYTDKRLDEISEKWEVSRRTVEQISTEVIFIKQEFTVQYLEKKIKEAVKEV